MPNPTGSATIMPNRTILFIQKSGTQEVQSNTAEPSKVLLNNAKPQKVYCAKILNPKGSVQ